MGKIMKTNNKPIGIIGGMGPFASSELLDKILVSARNNYGAKRDQDFPEILLASIPVENFFLDKNDAGLVLEKINEKVTMFENQGVLSFGIACNTAHLLADDIKKSQKIKLVSIIEQTVNKAKKMDVSRVGLLGSPVTINSKLYENKLKESGIDVVLPNEDQTKLLGVIISDLVAKKQITKNRKLLVEIAKSLVREGAEVIILGCTELPLAFPKNFEVPVVNTIEVLADSLVERYYK